MASHNNPFDDPGENPHRSDGRNIAFGGEDATLNPFAASNEPQQSRAPQAAYTGPTTQRYSSSDYVSDLIDLQHNQPARPAATTYPPPPPASSTPMGAHPSAGGGGGQLKRMETFNTDTGKLVHPLRRDCRYRQISDYICRIII